jgi:pimeloyl-ACP methyl ester carboxylesterase
MPTTTTENGSNSAYIGSSYSGLPNELVKAANGVDYVYRDSGPTTGEGVPLVLLQHFRGNLDNWDPALIDALASARRVITFDNAGVGGSTGRTSNTVAQMADDAIAFLAAMDLGQVDLLGFSIGGFVAQQIALTRPAIVRRLVLASAARPRAPRACATGPLKSSARLASPKPAPRNISAFSSLGPPQACRQAKRPCGACTPAPRTGTRQPSWATREAQYDAVCTWGIPDHAQLQRLSCLKMPVFVANGDSDPMILPHYSYLLAGLIPQARVKIYADSAHGFLFQHHADFAADVEAFLSDSH